jgi:hypothetical protein
MPPRARSRNQRDSFADVGFPLNETLNADADIEALVIITMMEATKSAQEDLKAIMAGIKAINAAKRRLRDLLCKINRDVVTATVSEVEKKGLAFSPNGLGGERAYHRVEIPIPDPESPGGVQVAVISLVDGKITSKSQLDAVVDAVKNDLDSMSELSEMESLRLQMAMDRRSKMMSTLSNLLKKISDTGDGLTQNLKG